MLVFLTVFVQESVGNLLFVCLAQVRLLQACEFILNHVDIFSDQLNELFIKSKQYNLCIIALILIVVQ